MSKLAVSAFCAGAVCKMYDDLVDNPKLHKYKTEFLLELLKGLHYILFAFLSINDTLYFCSSYLTVFINSICDKKAYHNPYENSLLYSFFIIFLFIDYNYTFLSIFYELFGVLFLLITGMIIESKVNKKEYSVWKLVIRILGVCFFSFLYLNVSHFLKNSMGYLIGYLSVSVMIQSYSLIMSSNDKIIQKDKKKQKKKRTLIKIFRNFFRKCIKSICPKIILKLINQLDNLQ